MPIRPKVRLELTNIVCAHQVHETEKSNESLFKARSFKRLKYSTTSKKIIILSNCRYQITIQGKIIVRFCHLNGAAVYLQRPNTKEFHFRSYYHEHYMAFLVTIYL